MVQGWGRDCHDHGSVHARTSLHRGLKILVLRQSVVICGATISSNVQHNNKDVWKRVRGWCRARGGCRDGAGIVTTMAGCMPGPPCIGGCKFSFCDSLSSSAAPLSAATCSIITRMCGKGRNQSPDFEFARASLCSSSATSRSIFLVSHVSLCATLDTSPTTPPRPWPSMPKTCSYVHGPLSHRLSFMQASDHCCD